MATATKLDTKAAQKLLEAEQNVRRRKSELEAAELELETQRKKLRARIPLSKDSEEKGKKIRTTTIAGISIRVTPARSGERFSMKRYKEAGHKVTPEMKSAISPGRAFDRWTVKAL